MSIKYPQDDKLFKAAGAVYLRKMKTAGVLDRAGSLLASKKTELMGAAIGAAVVTGIQYMANKKGPGGTSKLQDATEKAHLMAKGWNTKDNPGFAAKMMLAGTKGSREVADIMAEHPLKGAMMFAPSGISPGMALAKYLKR